MILHCYETNQYLTVYLGSGITILNLMDSPLLRHFLISIDKSDSEINSMHTFENKMIYSQNVVACRMLLDLPPP